MSENKQASALSFRPIGLTELPTTPDGLAAVDLFVYLSLQKRFVVYIPKGEKITSQRKDALNRHSVPCLYLRETDVGAAAVTQAEPDENASTIQNFEVMGLPGNTTLNKVFEELSKNLEAPPQAAIQKLEGMADEILATVAPDAMNLKSRFSANVDYLWLMNDASAISTLATMFAAANGINSVKPLRDIVFATLVMDLPLAKLEQSQIETYLAKPSELPQWVIDQIEEHPFQAYQLAKKTLPHLNDSTFELILVHHERYNGTGYPRHLKSVQIFPLGQVFCAAVATFERMKISAKTDQQNMIQIIKSLADLECDPHMQPHRKEIILNVARFLGFPMADGKRTSPFKVAA